jgi:hypothetical protein
VVGCCLYRPLHVQASQGSASGQAILKEHSERQSHVPDVTWPLKVLKGVPFHVRRPLIRALVAFEGQDALRLPFIHTLPHFAALIHPRAAKPKREKLERFGFDVHGCRCDPCSGLPIWQLEQAINVCLLLSFIGMSV